MSPERWQQIADVFGRVMDATASERPRILDEACDGDDELRREIEELIAADLASSGILDDVVDAAADAIPKDMSSEEADALAEAGVTMGGRIDERYEVLRVLGMGGMGIVVEAMHHGLDERVAIKLLRPRALGTPRTRQRFVQEARAAAKMRSPHIAKVRDVGVLPSGAPFMVMDLLHGADLASALRARGSIERSEAVRLTLQICEGLATAHARGVVHRDIKPANVFLEHASHGEIVAKILDFGISKIVNAEDDAVLTRSSDLVGSPAYMSPEQLRSSRDVDARADIWSLGIVLYEMLAGARPFLAESLVDITSKILHDPPPPLDDDLGEAIQAVITRCTQKRREHRYPDVAALAAELAPLAGAEGHRIARRVAQTLGQTAAVFEASDTVSIADDTSHAREMVRPRPRAGLTLLGLAALVGVAIWWIRKPQPPAPAAAVTTTDTPGTVVVTAPTTTASLPPPIPPSAESTARPIGTAVAAPPRVVLPSPPARPSVNPFGSRK